MNGRVELEFADGTKRTLTDEQYEQRNLRTLSSRQKQPGPIGIKSALQTNEKPLEEAKHSF